MLANRCLQFFLDRSILRRNTTSATRIRQALRISRPRPRLRFSHVVSAPAARFHFHSANPIPALSHVVGRGRTSGITVFAARTNLSRSPPIRRASCSRSIPESQVLVYAKALAAHPEIRPRHSASTGSSASSTIFASYPGTGKPQATGCTFPDGRK